MDFVMGFDIGVGLWIELFMKVDVEWLVDELLVMICDVEWDDWECEYLFL